MWQHLYVSGTEKAHQLSGEIHDAVFALMATGLKDAAVFSKLDDERDGTYFYFSPQAERIAMTFGAKPCERSPLRQEVGSLIGGDQTVINRLFL